MSDVLSLADVLLEADEILDYGAFAAQRSARLKIADADIAPFVRDDLLKSDWDDTINAASQLWLDIYSNLAPSGYPQHALEQFQAELGRSLEKTKIGDDGPDQAQLDRITRYVGTATVNDATLSGTFAAGGRQTRWISMHDDDVRNSHVRADGQTRAVNESFEVGGSKLRYPGDPLGPPEEVINCRCYIAPVGRLARRNIMAAVAAPTDIDEDALLDEELDETVDIDDEDLVDDDVDIPWHSVLAPEEQATGDGRMFAKDSISWRNLPLPLLYQHETGVNHGGSVRVGRIDEIWKPEGSNEIRARGVFNRTTEAQRVIEGIMDGSVRGVSVDVDDMELDFERSTDDGQDAYGGTMVFSRARVAGLTIVAIPAYQEAYIALGEAFEDELSEEDHAALAACGCDGALQLEEIVSPDERTTPATVGADTLEPITAAAGTKDGPGWITNPRATSRIRRYWTSGKGAAKIRWGQPGDFNRCRMQLAKYVRNPEWLAGTCANMHKEALGLWPGMERGGRHSILTAVPAATFTQAALPQGAAGVSVVHGSDRESDATVSTGRVYDNAPSGAVSFLVASAANPLKAAWFQDPQLDGPTPLTLVEEPDGTIRFVSHVATWGVCHIGINDVCTTAPHSAASYAYFRTGVVDTDEGQIPVGQITMKTGHASLGATARAAAAHYDNTGSVVADVAAGEDAYGIWVAGVLRPGVSAGDIAELQAASLSGDWRYISGSLEMVAALAVNVPGFPIPRIGLAASAGSGTTALVAAGVVPALQSATSAFSDLDQVAAVARTAVQEYIAELARQEQVKERTARVTPIRDQVKSLRLAAVREKFEVK
jgi:hypothetical protein